MKVILFAKPRVIPRNLSWVSLRWETTVGAREHQGFLCLDWRGLCALRGIPRVSIRRHSIPCVNHKVVLPQAGQVELYDDHM